MSTDPIDALLEKLSSGDLAAAEQVFLTYEPYLRKVVRRRIPKQIRAKFDSLDVVQSIWVDLLPGFREAAWHFDNAKQLRDFLIEVTRNRCIDRCRHFIPMATKEHPLAESGPVAAARPTPSEIAEADDLWNQMLAACPPAHHEVLHLKRQGLLLAEIAARTGLHEGSVRRILRNLARKFSLRQKPILPSERNAEPPG